MGLGDLPGGDFNSVAFGVSADGSTVVGHAAPASGMEAFAWHDGVFIPLGDLPGSDVSSVARSASWKYTYFKSSAPLPGVPFASSQPNRPPMPAAPWRRPAP
ncbi:MAG: hypothetical protein ABII12_02185 [Planctomycetota bacterium]